MYALTLIKERSSPSTQRRKSPAYKTTTPIRPSPASSRLQQILGEPPMEGTATKLSTLQEVYAWQTSLFPDSPVPNISYEILRLAQRKGS